MRTNYVGDFFEYSPFMLDTFRNKITLYGFQNRDSVEYDGYFTPTNAELKFLVIDFTKEQWGVDTSVFSCAYYPSIAS